MSETKTPFVPKKAPDRIKVDAKIRRFLKEYVACDYNATKAYLRIFPNHSYGTARAQSCVILANSSVKAELVIIQEENAKRLNITPGRLMDRLAAIAFADIGDAFTPGGKDEPDQPIPLSQMDPATRKAIQSVKTKKGAKGKGKKKSPVIEVEVKMYSAPDAIDKLCKLHGLYEKDPPPTEPDKPPVPPMTESERMERIQAILLAAHGRLKAQEQAAAEKPAVSLPEVNGDESGDSQEV